MARWRLPILGLLLAALTACGGATATSPAQTLADPTATAAPTRTPAPSVAARASAAPAAPMASTAPGATANPSAAAPSRASAAPTATRSPAASASAPPGPTAVPQPNGAIPAGWQIYRGTPTFPFVVAYPPDWTVDDSLLPDQRVIYLYGPDGRDDTPERIDIEISQTGAGANIDVQRDEFFRQESDFCDAKGIEYTEQRQVAGVAFAVLGATCDASNVLSFMQVASGLKHGDEWNILMRTSYDRKEARLREVFDPILASLNIYAAIPE
jgi:hypothetical protein